MIVQCGSGICFHRESRWTTAPTRRQVTAKEVKITVLGAVQQSFRFIGRDRVAVPTSAVPLGVTPLRFPPAKFQGVRPID